jgi:quercetin dioxygenase-like cupin family protein
MKIHDPRRVAAGATSPNTTRPAAALLHDSPDARLVVFRIEPGQAVAPHVSESSVTLTVFAGRGMVSGAAGEREVSEGDVVWYDPGERHGMSAIDEEFVLLAAIMPRPGPRPAA